MFFLNCFNSLYLLKALVLTFAVIKNLKSGRPRVQEDQIIITLNLKSEDKQDELPLDFTFAKTDNDWKIDRIAKVN